MNSGKIQNYKGKNMFIVKFNKYYLMYFLPMVVFGYNKVFIKIYRMSKVIKGHSCFVSGCRKRKKNKEREGQSVTRSDSDGSSDEESMIKRLYPRTFHA